MIDLNNSFAYYHVINSINNVNCMTVLIDIPVSVNGCSASFSTDGDDSTEWVTAIGGESV